MSLLEKGRLLYTNVFFTITLVLNYCSDFLDPFNPTKFPTNSNPGPLGCEPTNTNHFTIRPVPMLLVGTTQTLFHNTEMFVNGDWVQIVSKYVTHSDVTAIPGI